MAATIVGTPQKFSGTDAPVFAFDSGTRPQDGNLVVVAFGQPSNNSYTPTGSGSWAIDSASLTDNTAFVGKVWASGDGNTDQFIDSVGADNPWFAVVYEITDFDDAIFDASGNLINDFLASPPLTWDFPPLTPTITGDLPLTSVIAALVPDGTVGTLTLTDSWTADDNELALSLSGTANYFFVAAEAPNATLSDVIGSGTFTDGTATDAIILQSIVLIKAGTSGAGGGPTYPMPTPSLGHEHLFAPTDDLDDQCSLCGANFAAHVSLT